MMSVPNVTIQIAPVILATIVNIILGSLWYSPLLFGNIWIKLSKFTKKDMAEAKKKGMGKTYFAALIFSFITSYVLAHFVEYTTARSIADGALLGFWLWLGFVVPMQAGMVLWEGKPVKLYFINILYYLVALMIMASIIAVW